MRTCSRLHSYYHVFDKNSLECLAHMLGVFRRYYVVGYDEHLLPHFKEPGCDCLYEGGFPGSYGAAYSYSASISHFVQELKLLIMKLHNAATSV